MKQPVTPPKPILSISEMHHLLGLKKPKHPLVSIIRFEDMVSTGPAVPRSISYNFYHIALKKNYQGKIKYGQQYYDFDEGMMTFIAPQQVITIDPETPTCLEGFMLIVHPDFLETYPLASKIRSYGFFSYAAFEALHLSEQEEQAIMQLVTNIEREIETNIDPFTQELIVSNIDLLLTYCNRFYNRQFITRKLANNDLLIKLETLLDVYFASVEPEKSGLPTVKYVADQLHVSASYLSDMLRAHTGQSTQQHIHNKLIEKAKTILSTTGLSVSEVAYQLGFEYPQSFNKLFKSKTNLSPLEFRQSFQ